MIFLKRQSFFLLITKLAAYKQRGHNKKCPYKKKRWFHNESNQIILQHLLCQARLINSYKFDCSQFTIIIREVNNMQTVRNMLMLYMVKLLAPQSPAYGNLIPFVKQQKLQQIISQLQVGDIIFTKTNNSWYQAARNLLKTSYDHVSVVINKNQVIHVSPPIICKLDINRIMIESRQPVVYRFQQGQINKEVLLDILINFIGEKYNQTAIPSMIKNEIVDRVLKAQQEHFFTFQNLKYSKICTQAILYALCKSNFSLLQKIQDFVIEKTNYKKIGFILPDQMMSFLQQNGAKIIHKSSETDSKTLYSKVQQSLDSIIQKFAFIHEINALTGGRNILQLVKNITKVSKHFLNKHPLLKVLSYIFFIYEIVHGAKFNKLLLIYSIISTLMIYRVMPENSKVISSRNSKL